MIALTTTLSALAFAGNVAAFWRMPCRSATGIARMDPLVAPNDVADHSHIIFGGGNFGLNTTFDNLAKCTNPEHNCTSCEVTQDKSAYWTPPIYFQHENGTVEMVPNVGGMLAYYLFYLDNVEPFPEGFAMIAGNPTYRNFSGTFPDEELSKWPTYPSDQFFLQQRAIGFNCLNYAKDPEASLYRHQFPKKDEMDANCLDGIRMEMAFPSCGTGELDSPDHRSHVAYPSLVKEGNCPDGYDHHYPFLFYETIYATQNFAGMPGQFLISTGDPVGTSYHADFIMGWESSEFLGKAIKTCTSETGLIGDCPLFNIQDDSEAAQCTFQTPDSFEKEDCEGPMEGLPVGVPIQYGPEPATKYPVQGARGVKTSSLPHTSAPATFTQPSLGYSPVNPASTSTAQGGIIVAYASSSSSAAPAITSAPAYAPPADDDVTTTYITKGHEVIEMVIEELEVTVTASPSEPAGYAHKHKRHLEKHAKRHNNH
ncbi:uncharacterized protein MYCFIDRAFT_87072 [Pseudocercospora fijiensis CIRAD86]|uniref:DUF1996 domain-containing protein n=1 Tax=Pseudocercospora fijiensis (strain CIRAD86) TaxID=383855 RepID=M3AXM8_PSEFD|nr:uncharacterized protein MYCFIDRAFT_87072 [Pseudocercospora fijiensis CIRAD86]EME81858.1 hypothetical protein MYCFIDRAFT_87072 [Pseudocercospora fijiensis CIRAD86]